jgi:hypothetical protein
VTAQGSSLGVRAYLLTVLLLLFVLPAGCVLAEAIAGRDASDLLLIVGKWFVFWGVGVRLFLAGVRQIFQPAFTATKIFELVEPGALPIVRELGFANVTMGALGLASLANGACSFLPPSSAPSITGWPGQDTSYVPSETQSRRSLSFPISSFSCCWASFWRSNPYPDLDYKLGLDA